MKSLWKLPRWRQRIGLSPIRSGLVEWLNIGALLAAVAVAGWVGIRQIGIMEQQQKLSELVVHTSYIPKLHFEYDETIGLLKIYNYGKGNILIYGKAFGTLGPQPLNNVAIVVPTEPYMINRPFSKLDLKGWQDNLINKIGKQGKRTIPVIWYLENELKDKYIQNIVLELKITDGNPDMEILVTTLSATDWTSMLYPEKNRMDN